MLTALFPSRLASGRLAGDELAGPDSQQPRVGQSVSVPATDPQPNKNALVRSKARTVTTRIPPRPDSGVGACAHGSAPLMPTISTGTGAKHCPACTKPVPSFARLGGDALRAVCSSSLLRKADVSILPSEDAPSVVSEQELAEFRENVREFSRRVIAPHAATIDKANSFPADVDLWREMGDFGLHGVTVPAEYGGLQLGYRAHCIAMEELSRCSGSVALSYGAHSNLCINQLVRNANPAQLEKHLPKLLSGEHVGALSISEPNSGSDAVSMQCRAAPRGGSFVLNGTKMWCTNGPTASVLIVYAKTEPEAGAHGITAFIVEKGMPGFSTAQKLDKLGMRGSDTCELVFDNCEVPAENVLGEVNKGVYVMMSGLDYERLVLAGGPLGLMQASLDIVLPYARERTQFGKPIGEFQLIQGKLADMYTVTQATRSLLMRTAAEADMGRASTRDCAAVILYAAERATAIALDAIQILGGNGYINDYDTGRILRDAKLYEIGAGTSEIRRMLIARELLKDLTM